MTHDSSPTDPAPLVVVETGQVDTRHQPESIHTQHLEDLAQEVVRLKLSILSDADAYAETTRQLRRRLSLLTTLLLLAVVLMGGATAGLAYFFQQERRWASQTGMNDRLTQLEQQVKTLNGQLPTTLVQDLQATQGKLATLEADQKKVQVLEEKLSTLADNVRTRKQTIAILANALQDLINAETTDAASPTNSSEKPTPTQSSPEITPDRQTTSSPEAKPSPEPTAGPTPAPATP